MKQGQRALLGGTVLLAMPGLAWANAVWPALYLQDRLLSAWSIALGLPIEWLILRHSFSLPAWRAAGVTVAANAASAVLGILLIPLAGFIWEIIPGQLLMALAHLGTFNPVTWGATFVLACLVNTGIELSVCKRIFKLPVGRREQLLVLAANGLSVGLAFASLWIWAPQ